VRWPTAAGAHVALRTDRRLEDATADLLALLDRRLARIASEHP
jgi:hypothetical protein